MFALRRLTSQGSEINTVLGEDYVIVDAEKNKEDYKHFLDKMKVSEDKDIYGFISYESGSKFLALYKKSTYFVMMSNGQTFANITFK